MTREQNLQAMMQLNSIRALATDPAEALRLHQAFYNHQIIEAILSGNIDSLQTAA